MPLDRSRSLRRLSTHRPRYSVALGFFLRHCDAFDKIDKAVRVAIRGDWRDLGRVVRKALDEVLYLFGCPILQLLLATSQARPHQATYLS